jgi:hypothetical protein
MPFFHFTAVFKEGTPMKKIVMLSVVAAASLGLAACSKSEDTAAANATNEAVIDANATAAEAVADVNAAAANVTDAAAAVENAAGEVANAADNAAN